jgi:mRNA interferase MazF
MQKDFDKWNEEKKKTDAEKPRLYTVREIWWCRLGVNVGTEQDGRGGQFTRPCIILRGLGPDACFVVPMTTSTRKHSLRIDVGRIEGKLAKANLSQIRVIDTRRLWLKIGFLKKIEFDKLKKSFKDML